MNPEMLTLALRRMRAEGVPRSDDWERINALPTRPPRGEAYVAEYTARLRRPRGTQTLTADQAQSLHDIELRRGGICLLKPGAGKTLVGTLAAVVLQAKNTLYLCPSAAKDQVVSQELPKINNHWLTQSHMVVKGFGEMSTKQGRQMIHRLMPDLIVIDEMHKLKNPHCARGNRIIEFLAEFPDTMVLGMTGSPSDRELAECAHLFRFALRAESPLPFDRSTVEQWSLAIGSDVPPDRRPGAGMLTAFVDLLPPEKQAQARDSLELVRWGFRERLRLTEGVIFSTVRPTATQITVRSPRLDVPDAVRDAFTILNTKNEVGQEQLVDSFEIAAAARQLICGFYYKWVWPNGEENKRWVEARKVWHKFVRGVLMEKPSRRQLSAMGVLANKWKASADEWKLPTGLDSKGLIEDACRAHEAYVIAREHRHAYESQLEPLLRFDCQPYRDWLAVRDEYEIVTKAVWLDDYLVTYATKWLEKNNGVVWVPFRTMGAKLESAGVKYFGGGTAGGEIIRYRGPCAASFKSHHESKELQHWSKCLYLLPPSTGQQWEQSIARFDRRGQTASAIDCEVLLLCRPTFNSWAKALQDAAYVHGAFDSQRLCQADLSEVLREEDIEDVQEGESDPLWFEKHS